LLINCIDTSIVYRFNDILLDSYSTLANLEYKTGNYKKAFDYNTEFSNLNDSLFSIEKEKRYAELYTKFETIQKENEINLLKSEKLTRENELKQNKLFKWIGFSVIMLFILIFSIGIIYYNQKRKANLLLTEKNFQIEEKNRELEDMNLRIIRINEELTVSKYELTKAVNAKNRFFSILAHELRNPFHTIIGQSFLLSKSYNKLSSEERKKYADNILCTCEQVNQLLENLLEWVRTQTHGIKFKPQQLNFNQLVSNSLSVLKNNADKKMIMIETRIDKYIFLKADYRMLETIVRNLVNNSIKFTPHGGSITLSALVNDGKLLTSISDTGVGIAKRNLGKLFRIDSNFKTRGTDHERGTGLGLIICKEFINFHKGEIWVESTSKKGTTFNFFIPMA
jgi:signal transduction histidine kinase